MRILVVLLALGVAVSAIPYKFNHDITINVYDVLKSLYAAAPLNAYIDHITKEGWFKFDESFFHFYPEEQITDVLVVYRPKGQNFLHGYYVKAEDVSKYDDTFFDAVRPIYEYLNSGEYYAFTPYAAKKIVPEYFNFPLKEIFYKYYKDVDTKHEIPVVFLVPKSEVDEALLEELILIADYHVSKDAIHDIHEHFDNAKTLKRRDIFYSSPYYRTVYPYTYNSAFYLKGYPYYYGYPEYLRSGIWNYHHVLKRENSDPIKK